MPRLLLHITPQTGELLFFRCAPSFVVILSSCCFVLRSFSCPFFFTPALLVFSLDFLAAHESAGSFFFVRVGVVEDRMNWEKNDHCKNTKRR